MSSGNKRRGNTDNSPGNDGYDVDLEWNENKETTTSWSAQISNKPRGRRVYGNSSSTTGRGRAPLARMRITDKIPQTLLQKLHLSSCYKRSSPASSAASATDDVPENCNPTHHSIVPSPLSDEATSSSLSKRKRMTETTSICNKSNNNKESIQSNSTASSPAFSSHSAHTFHGQSSSTAAAASSHREGFGKFKSEKPAHHSNSSNLRSHIRFGSDPGGWTSSSCNPAIDLRALLLQASSSTSSAPKLSNHSSSNVFTPNKGMTNGCVKRRSQKCPGNRTTNELPPHPTAFEAENKVTFDHISSSSSSSLSDDQASKSNQTLISSKRMFISSKQGRKYQPFRDDDHDDITSSDSSASEDHASSCNDDDDNGQSDSEGITYSVPQTFICSATALNQSLDENMLQQIIATLPSRQVVSYLLQQIHIMAKKQRGITSYAASYNNNWLTVVPPLSWNTSRKNELIKWATKTLGFTLRNASAGVEFMQIKIEKALKIKSLIEAALRERKLRSHQVVGNEKKLTSDDDLNTMPVIIWQHSRSKVIPSELSNNPRRSAQFTHLPLKQRPDATLEDLPDIGSLQIHGQEGYQKDNTGILQQSNFEVDRLPRLSVEQSLPTQDIMFHMAGISPRPVHHTSSDGERKPLKESRVDYYHQRKISNFESMLDTEMIHVEKSPPVSTFSSKSTKKPQLKRSSSERLSFEGRRDHISPLPQFSAFNKIRLKESNQSSCKKEEQVITPMLTRTSQSYFSCSQHPNTTDWGASTKCDPSILEVLLRRFEVACERAAGKVLHQASGTCIIFESTASLPSFPPCASEVGVKITQNDDDEAEDNDSVVPLLGAPHFGSVDEHQKLNVRRIPLSPFDMHKRKRDSLAKLHRQSICKAVKDFCPQRLTLKPAAPFLLSTPENKEIIKSDGLYDCAAFKIPFVDEKAPQMPATKVYDNQIGLNCASFMGTYLPSIFDFLSEKDLMCKASLVCTRWADVAAYSLAKLMLISVGCRTDIIQQGKKEEKSYSDSVVEDINAYDRNENYLRPQSQSIIKSMEKSWAEMNRVFPWASFLAEGAYKKVYRVWNAEIAREEAISVMDVCLIESMGNKTVIGAELAVSVLLSSLARRNICPNFVITRGMFSCRYEPPASHWGCVDNKQPLGSTFDPRCFAKKPRQPNPRRAGKFQYIRMELCKFGDLEKFIANQPDKDISSYEARHLLFQMAFSLYAASSQFGMKHYDVKLLNFFLQSANEESINVETHPCTILRYGVGHYIFDLKMPTTRAYIAKLADYGTADLQQDSQGNPVTLGQFTTLENSPPEQLILGDEALQGFGHDLFGLGLCMLHLFTGDAPYEEILQDVICPPALKKKLKQIWLSEKKSSGFCVIRSVILSDVFEDENNIAQGKPDETLYHTLYRYLVLFGIPKDKFQNKKSGSVWKAIVTCLGDHDDIHNEKPDNQVRKHADRDIYVRDRRFFSFFHGCDRRIARAREKLQV